MTDHNQTFLFPPMVPDEVRLLHLQPAYYFGYSIICSLNTWSQNVAESRYEALSYVWGVYEAENLLPITVNGMAYRITRNLDSALRHLRSSTQVRSLWVDAVCLDQNNLEEKNWAVPNMHLVYGSARSVIAWVGKADSGTSLALDLAKTLSKVCDEPSNPASSGLDRDEHFLNLITSKQLSGQLPKSDSLQWASITVLFLPEWWDRVWTLQEAVHARDYNLVWGSSTPHSISGRDLEKAMQLLRYLEVYGLISNSVVETLLDTLDLSGRLTEIETFRRNKDQPKLMSLGAALAASRHRLATNTLDHVYGCLSLASTAQYNLEVDYAKAVSQVFEDATRALIDEGQSLCGGLNFLSVCSSTIMNRLGLLTPSWTVILGERDEYDPLCTPFGVDLRFAAAGSYPGAAVYSTELRPCRRSSILTVRGKCVGEVETVSTIGVPSSLGTDAEENVAMHNFHNECKGILIHARVDGAASNDPDLSANLYRTFICDWTIDPAAMPAANESWSPAYMRFARRTCSGRRFLFTPSGYMGLAPHATRIGDFIYLIAGCDVPLILRKVSISEPEPRLAPMDGKELRHSTALGSQAAHNCQGKCYQIVGNAYVHGIMRGEAAVPGDHDSPIFDEIHLH